MSGTTLLTAGLVFTDYLLPIREEQLRKEGYKHACGGTWNARALDVDGQVFRWVSGTDQWEVIVYLRCANEACDHTDDAYHYGRIQVGGKVITKTHSGSFLEALTLELDGLFEDFKTLL